jgi:tetratricopeptide (TPR) repeat protein
VSSEALYERYKDALKRGHVASLRGHIDEALIAYAEAARIAPERATPHASAGTALLRRRRPAEALQHYDVALAMAPREESALLGRAQALTALDRRGEAADAYDTLAEVQAANGRLGDAVDAARRGLELAEGRERRRTLEQLITRLRASQPGEPGRQALERALLVLDGSAVQRADAQSASGAGAEPPRRAARATAGRAAAAPAGLDPASRDEAAASARPPTGPVETAQRAASGASEAAPAPAGPPTHDAAPGPAPTSAEPGVGAADAPERGEGTSEPGQDTPSAAPGRAPRLLPDGATTAELEARAEAAADAGVPGPAVDTLLDLAALHARDGRVAAALEACYTAVSFDPDSIALHLALVELYAGRGWDALAGEKLDLLERLARLDGDESAIADIAIVREARGPGPGRHPGPV